MLVEQLAEPGVLVLDLALDEERVGQEEIRDDGQHAGGVLRRTIEDRPHAAGEVQGSEDQDPAPLGRECDGLFNAFLENDILRVGFVSVVAVFEFK